MPSCALRLTQSVLLPPSHVVCRRQAKLVKQEQQAIDAQFEKKRKNAEVAQKMYVPACASSHASNTNVSPPVRSRR